MQPLKLQIDVKEIKKGSRGYKQDHYLITFQWVQLTQTYMPYGGMIFTWAYDKTSTSEHKSGGGGQEVSNLKTTIKDILKLLPLDTDL